MAEFFNKIILVLVTAALTYIITFRNTRRQELRERIKSIEDQINRIVETASGYWSVENSPREAALLAASIKCGSTQIGREIRRLEIRSNRFSSCWTPLKSLRQQMMSGPFESQNYDPDPTRVKAIRRSADDLISSLRKAARIV